jgi:SNF2 family DNA or RNA helicase
LRKTYRVEGNEPSVHPWGADAGQIVSALAALGLKRGDNSAGCEMELLLPSSGGYPIPSAPLLGEAPAPGGERAAMRRWLVEALPVSVADLSGVRDIFESRDGMSGEGLFLARGIMAAFDLCYVMECCSFAVSLLERGRFLPDIRISEEMKYEPVWSPILIGGDATRYERMVRAMPDAIRVMGDSPGQPKVVFHNIFEDFTDGLARYSWIHKGSGDVVPTRKIAKAIIENTLAAVSPAREKKRRGKLVNALNPHALWIRSLGWSGETDGLSQSLESIYPEVLEWRERCGWFKHAPFKLRMRFAGGGEDPARWRLEYSLRRLGEDDAVSARDVWNGQGPASNPETGGYMRRYLLFVLGKVGAGFRPVRDSLDLQAPEECPLTHEEAAEFLQNTALELSDMGIEVEYPSWWYENSSEALTVRGVKRGEGFGLEWELFLCGEILSDDEKQAIVYGKSPLVKVRRRWMFISPNRLSSLLRCRERPPGRMSFADAVKLAISNPLVDGFDGLPELETVYNALARNAPLELLDAPPAMNGTLRPYQKRGYSWLSFLSGLGVGACLADDMGLGKTLQALALVQRHRDSGHVRPVLLVCPTSVIENWKQEAERFFPDMRFYIHHGINRLKGEDFAFQARRSAMVISSYSLLRRDLPLYKGIDWLGVILDEAQSIKNPDTGQARAARGIKSDWKAALTGTPIENHAGDLWSIMEFLMPGMLGGRRHFTSTYVKPMRSSRDSRVLERLKRAVSPFIMRRLKSDPDILPELPEKIQTKVYCGLKKEQAKLYARVTNELNRDVGRSSGIKRKALVLAGLTRMKQICDHPALVEKDDDFGCERSSKLERLLSLAEEMFEAGDRALIFTQYVRMGAILKFQLQERFGREAFLLHGGLTKDARDKMIRAFQRGTGPQFFVLSLRAGGVGINLTAASHVVLYDRWWNPAVEAQAIDRAHRIGQVNSLQVHIFCCKGTLEERIDELLSSKKVLADSVITKNDNWLTKLSDLELKNLISLSPKAFDS